MRTLIRFLLFLGLLLVIAPFAISSLFIDQKGITITGHVHSKDERIVVRESTWTRALDVTVEYELPHGSGMAFLKARVTPDRFDEFKKGDPVQLRYLRREDVPHLPGADALWQLHLLPTARLADQQAWSGLKLAFSDIIFKAILALIAVLTLWRIARIPLFGWAVALCVLSAIGVSLFQDFPTQVPAPENNICSASGTVKSIDNVEWLFRGGRQKGFKADQPVQIVGVQFIPAGRSEPVLAVDLIDAGSVSGLREHAPVSIDYEAAAPRRARIHGGTRDFVRRNLQGIAFELVVSLAVILVLLLGASLIGKGYRWLTHRNSV